MRTTLSGPLAASMLLLSASVLPAKADVLYSLTGVVGDSNWSLADFRRYNQPFGSLQMFADLASVFQANGGPGGFITVDFSGPPLLVTDSHIYYSVNSLTALCVDTSGCVNGNGYVYYPFQGGGPAAGPVPYPIDSSLHVQDLEIPPFAPYQAGFEGYAKGYVGYTFLASSLPAHRSTFREDLYYRLNVVTLNIPPLRERREDIPLLFAHFLSRAAIRFHRASPSISDAVRRHLVSHDWPGNVRELAHFAERVALGVADAELVRPSPGTPP